MKAFFLHPWQQPLSTKKILECPLERIEINVNLTSSIIFLFFRWNTVVEKSTDKAARVNVSRNGHTVKESWINISSWEQTLM